MNTLKISNDTSQYKVGIYIRLSKEDDDKGVESESITNQRNLLLQYLKENNLLLVKEYVDDGYSGTSFDRPQFNELIRDIEQGLINMVITKDLSRLGRDYIKSGYYVENYFPEKRVRYIALLDNIDTFLDSSSNDIAPFKSVLNDMYAKDASKKIKSVLKSKKEQGLFVGKEAPYGYMKNPNNKYQLLIDKEASIIVKEIFDLTLQGFGTTKIANLLSERKVKIPSVHKNINRGNRSSHYGLWNNKTVKTIIKNEVYTGTLVQNRYNKLNYKSKKLIETDETVWIKTENAHEQIIDSDTFNRVQKLLKVNKGLKPSRNVYLLTGLLYCHDCGSYIGMSKKDNRGYSYGRCGRYAKFSKFGVCTPHSFNYEKLEQTVLQTLRDICKKYLNEAHMQNVLKQCRGRALRDPLKEAEDKISIITNSIEKLNQKIDTLYDDRINEVISTEDFVRLSAKINEERESLRTELDRLNEQKQSYSSNKKQDVDMYEKTIKEFLSLKNPTKEILAELIDRIEIHQDKTIDIYFKFSELQDLMVA